MPCSKPKGNQQENEEAASVKSSNDSAKLVLGAEEQQYDKSYQLLEVNHLKHRLWCPNFTADNWQQNLSECASEATNGLTPHDWQLDIAEALKYKLDCLVLAGTGAGKTLTFVLNLLVDKNPNHKVLILSPPYN
jgi:ATP-dependent helicase YprA (DUF1998 family)